MSKSVETSYSPEDIVRFNQNYWDSIVSIDMQFTADEICKEGKFSPEYPTRWIKSGNKERLTWHTPAKIKKQPTPQNKTNPTTDIYDVIINDKQIIEVFDSRKTNEPLAQTVDDAILAPFAVNCRSIKSDIESFKTPIST
ncbi:MAG: hypothetical protein LBP59_16385 [Planctomycetaceae bacterium]|nr:hypothetical protein [Planctomycetaceae bacterium]